MARFYDAASDSELYRVAGLLRKNGIEYSLNSVLNSTPMINEIMVAEEDLAFAEFLICENSTLNS